MGSSFMCIKCIESSKYKWTVCTVITESVWVMLALNVVPHIASRLVSELQTDATHWYPCLILGHQTVEVFWFCDST